MVTHLVTVPGLLRACSNASSAPLVFFSFLTRASTAFSAHFSSSSPCFHPRSRFTAGDVKLNSEFKPVDILTSLVQSFNCCCCGNWNFYWNSLPCFEIESRNLVPSDNLTDSEFRWSCLVNNHQNTETISKNCLPAKLFSKAWKRLSGGL